MINDRLRMIETQISRRGIRDPLVLAALGKVPRENFVPQGFSDMAYRDGPLPIGFGQTISQPYIVAMMTEALQLKGGEHVLEIGTGSGYGAAILAEIAGTVVTVERISDLAERARNLLQHLNYTTITVIAGDGTKGCAQFAPYDAIAVTAGGPSVPRSLCDQLTDDGRLVIPVGTEETNQILVRVTRLPHDKFREESLCAVRFVPLVGEEGWPDAAPATWQDPDLFPGGE